MYAHRFTDGPRFRPAGLGAALAINGAFVAALLLANPDIVPPVVRDPTIIFDVPVPEPIPEPRPQPRTAEPRARPSDTVVIPRPEVAAKPTSETVVTGDTVIREPAGPAPGTGTGTGTDVGPADPPIAPAFVAAREDPRYLADFQPPYPDFERDAGREGVVKLRIRIGVDGRVKQVERIDGRDSFARAAITHALAKWRFKPATRGGVPEESWKIMLVRFTLSE